MKRNVTLEATRIDYPLGNTTPVKARTIDLSNTGLRFRSDETYETDTLLQVAVTLPGWTKHHPGFINPMENSVGRPFTALSKVKRCESKSGQYDIAVEFVNVDSDDMRGLHGYLSNQIEEAVHN